VRKALCRYGTVESKSKGVKINGYNPKLVLASMKLSFKIYKMEIIPALWNYIYFFDINIRYMYKTI
jgi:hypothetical protein